MSAPFVVQASGSAVDGWASAPLPFEPKGWMLEYRQALRAGLGQLVPARGHTLVGRYASADPRRCDVENLLLYNIGLSAFAHLNVHGVVLTRSWSPPPAPEHSAGALLHHHRYELADSSPPAGEGSVVARLAPTPLRTPVRVERVWYDLRRSGRITAADGVPGHRLAVNLTVHRPPGQPQPGLLSLVKIVVDGFVGALHTHDGTDLEVVAERLGARLGVTGGEVGRLLVTNPAGVLGVRRLLWPFRKFVQWNPADDDIVGLQVTTAASPLWQLSGVVTLS